MKKVDPQLADALNAQMNLEQYNFTAYHVIGDVFDEMHLGGMEHFCRKSAKDERKHAHKFESYMIKRGLKPEYIEFVPLPIPAADVMTLWATAQQLEAKTTEAIDALYALAEEVEDNPTCLFLHWFIKEQVESEHELLEIVARLQMFQPGAGYALMDKEIGKKA